MTPITLTRFNVKPRSYGFQDTYRACLKSTPQASCHGIQSYMDGLMTQMNTYVDEPTAWSFSEWRPAKSTNNTLEYWQAGTAIVLEYRGTDQPATVAAELHAKANALGYAHILMDSLSRKGATTITIVFPLTESVSKEQYARLASVLMEELGQYRAAAGNMACTHLIHVDRTCGQVICDGAVIAPRAKIKETEKAYQNMDCKRFEAAGAYASAQLAAPTMTSHDGLFEWKPSPAEAAQLNADALLASIGVQLTDQEPTA